MLVDGCPAQHRTMKNLTQVLILPRSTLHPSYLLQPGQDTFLSWFFLSLSPTTGHSPASLGLGDSSPRGQGLFLIAKGLILGLSGKSRLEGYSLHHLSQGQLAGWLSLFLQGGWPSRRFLSHSTSSSMDWASLRAFPLSSIFPGYLVLLGKHLSPRMRLHYQKPSSELVPWGLA